MSTVCSVCKRKFAKPYNLDRHFDTTRCGELRKEARRRRFEATADTEIDSVKRRQIDDCSADNVVYKECNNADDEINASDLDSYVPLGDIDDDDLNASTGDFVDNESDSLSDEDEPTSDEDETPAPEREHDDDDNDDGDDDGGRVLAGDFDRDLSRALYELIHQVVLAIFVQNNLACALTIDHDLNTGHQARPNCRQTVEAVESSWLESAVVDLSAAEVRRRARGVSPIENRSNVSCERNEECSSSGLSLNRRRYGIDVGQRL